MKILTVPRVSSLMVRSESASFLYCKALFCGNVAWTIWMVHGFDIGEYGDFRRWWQGEGYFWKEEEEAGITGNGDDVAAMAETMNCPVSTVQNTSEWGWDCVVCYCYYHTTLTYVALFLSLHSCFLFFSNAITLSRKEKVFWTINVARFLKG